MATRATSPTWLDIRCQTGSSHIVPFVYLFVCLFTIYFKPGTQESKTELTIQHTLTLRAGKTLCSLYISSHLLQPPQETTIIVAFLYMRK